MARRVTEILMLVYCNMTERYNSEFVMNIYSEIRERRNTLSFIARKLYFPVTETRSCWPSEIVLLLLTTGR